MAFVTPAERIPAFIVLACGGIDAQSAVRICFGFLFRVKFILGKELGIVLLCICCNGCEVQTNKKAGTDQSALTEITCAIFSSRYNPKK